MSATSVARIKLPSRRSSFRILATTLSKLNKLRFFNCIQVYYSVYSVYGLWSSSILSLSLSFYIHLKFCIIVDRFYVLLCFGTLLVFAGVMPVALCFTPSFSILSGFIELIVKHDVQNKK